MRLNSKILPQFKAPTTRLRLSFLVGLIVVIPAMLAYVLSRPASDSVDRLIHLPTPTSLTEEAVAPAVDTDGNALTSIEPEAAAAASSPNTFYLSLAKDAAQTIGSVSEVGDEDILSFDGLNFALVFDGSAAGLPANVDVDAFHVVDADTILISFDRSVSIDQLRVDDSDIVTFEATSLGPNKTAGTFSLFFDGSTVDLTTKGENVDALTLLPDGMLLISTEGRARVPGLNRNLRVENEDILAFSPAAPGDYRSGDWSLYFDGSNVGIRNSSENIDGLAAGANGELYLTTTGNFSVQDLDGRGEDIFSCTPTSLDDGMACTFSPALFFEGRVYGLSRNDIDAISVP